MKEYKDLIKEARWKKRITYQKLSDKLKISVSMLSDVENGRRLTFYPTLIKELGIDEDEAFISWERAKFLKDCKKYKSINSKMIKLIKDIFDENRV